MITSDTVKELYIRGDDIEAMCAVDSHGQRGGPKLSSTARSSFPGRHHRAQLNEAKTRESQDNPNVRAKRLSGRKPHSKARLHSYRCGLGGLEDLNKRRMDGNALIMGHNKPIA